MSIPVDRPEHPDFWLLSQVLIEMDGQAQSGQDVPDIVGRLIDPESAIYAAFQRALRIRALRISRREVGELAGVWLDGLLAGMMVRHLKDREMTP